MDYRHWIKAPDRRSAWFPKLLCWCCRRLNSHPVFKIFPIFHPVPSTTSLFPFPVQPSKNWLDGRFSSPVKKWASTDRVTVIRWPLFISLPKNNAPTNNYYHNATLGPLAFSTTRTRFGHTRSAFRNISSGIFPHAPFAAAIKPRQFPYLRFFNIFLDIRLQSSPSAMTQDYSAATLF